MFRYCLADIPTTLIWSNKDCEENEAWGTIAKRTVDRLTFRPIVGGGGKDGDSGDSRGGKESSAYLRS